MEPSPPFYLVEFLEHVNEIIQYLHTENARGCVFRPLAGRLVQGRHYRGRAFLEQAAEFVRTNFLCPDLLGQLAGRAISVADPRHL